MTTATHGITWQPKGHVSSGYSGLHAVTLPGFHCWVWVIFRGLVPTGTNGVGFATEEDARRDAERAIVEMAKREAWR